MSEPLFQRGDRVQFTGNPDVQRCFGIGEVVGVAASLGRDGTQYSVKFKKIENPVDVWYRNLHLASPLEALASCFEERP